MLFNPNYPKTPKHDFKEELHGKTINDPYRWLESLDSLEVQEWIAKQNEYTNAILARPEREQIKKQLRELLDLEKQNPYESYGNYFFFSKKIKGKNQPFLMVKNKINGKERILIDPNNWSEDGTVAIDWYFPSPDGNFLIYGRSSHGDERSTLYILNVETNEVLDDTIPYTRYSSVAWNADNSGFFYTRYPKPGDVPKGDENYHRKLYYHQIEDDYLEDRLIIGDLSEKEEIIEISLSLNKKSYLITRTTDWAKKDLYFKVEKDAEIITICKNLDGHFRGDFVDDRLIIMTNYQAPKGRVVQIDPDNPQPKKWVVLVPESEDILENVHFIGGKIVAKYMHNCSSILKIFDISGELLHDLQLPTSGTVYYLHGSWEDEDFYFQFESFLYPFTVFKSNVEIAQIEEIYQTESSINADDYIINQIWYESKDGTSIPMFILKGKNTELSSTTPAYLYGYGGFKINLQPSFKPEWKVWLDNDSIIVIANLRGGGEFGKEWHEAGRKAKKQNVFDDFIAAAEWLIDQKYTDQHHLVIAGGSNGGLLVGAALTQRPELFKAVICAVPLLDMLRYDKFLIARLWTQEYGDPDDVEAFNYLYAYSPYHNVSANESYPAVYFKTAESDSRVHPLHAMKMTAKLQDIENNNPTLFRIETKTGHGVGKPVTKIVEETAEWLTFALWQVGKIE